MTMEADAVTLPPATPIDGVVLNRVQSDMLVFE